MRRRRGAKINAMLAVLLMLGIFLCATTIGFALVSIANGGRTLLLNVLVSPAAGFCAVVLPTQCLNRLGLPVERFAAPLVLFELACAAFVFVRCKPVVPWKVLWPFGPILAVAFVLALAPMARYGFDWVSYGSSDMPHYAVDADHFARNGYYAAPSTSPVDLSKAQPWLIFAAGGERSGVEVLLADVTSITRLHGVEAFMPFIGAGYFALLLATAGMVARRSSRPVRAYAAAAALALSPITTLSVLEQLLGQVFGLAVCAALAALVFDDRFYARTRDGAVRAALLIGTLGGGFVAIYPEITPIFLIACAGYVAVWLRRHRIDLRRALTLALWVALPSAVFLNTMVLHMLLLIATRSAGADRSESSGTFFPFYLVPSGITNFWGFVAIPTFPSEPQLSLLIAAGLVLLAVLYGAAGLALRQRSKPAFVCAAMLLLGIVLFARSVDYGLYKLAMFLQPFALATMVDVRLAARRAWLPIAATLAICLAGLPAQRFYLSVSADAAAKRGTSFAGIPGASAYRFVSQLDGIDPARVAPFVVSDSANVSLQLMETDFTQRPFVFAADNLAYYIQGGSRQKDRLTSASLKVAKLLTPAAIIAVGEQLAAAQRSISQRHFFAFGPRSDQNAYFYPTDLSKVERMAGRPWLLTNKTASILNGLEASGPPGRFGFLPMSGVSNHLDSVEASLAMLVGGRFDRVAIFSEEPDYFFPGSGIAALGRYALFRVDNPTTPLRLEMDLTTTVKNGDRALPPARVIGTTTQRLPFLGRGSARVVSDPIQPRDVNGEAYIGTDLGVDGTTFPFPRPGLMGLFGKNVLIDPRRVVAFGRDISVVSDAAYRAWNRPTTIAAFPGDLADRHLEYSGIYEDGWISEHSYFVLQATPRTRHVFVKGIVPLVAAPGFSTELRVAVDGKPLLGARVPVGAFAFDPPVRLAPGAHRIDLEFSRAQRLPMGDGRLVSALLGTLSLDAPQAAANAANAVEGDIVPQNGGCRLGANWDALERYAGETFRWVSNDAELAIDARVAGTVDLALTAEAGPGAVDGRVGLSFADRNGRRVANLELGPRTSTTVTLPVHAGSNAFRIEVSGGEHRIASDPRILNARFFKLAVRQR